VKVCGLLLEGEELKQLREFEENGYSVVKLKVGGHFKDDVARIKTIFENTKKLRLRLDFNSRCAIKEWGEFFSDLPSDRIEYIEDPVPQESLLSFSKLCPFNVAIDEDISGSTEVSNYIKVIKPMKVGWNRVEELTSDRKAFVLSSSFESNLGLCHLGHAAKVLESANSFHGLGTGRFFKENFFDIDLNNGSLCIPSSRWLREKMSSIVSCLSPITERAL